MYLIPEHCCIKSVVPRFCASSGVSCRLNFRHAGLIIKCATLVTLVDLELHIKGDRMIIFSSVVAP